MLRYSVVVVPVSNTDINCKLTPFLETVSFDKLAPNCVPTVELIFLCKGPSTSSPVSKRQKYLIDIINVAVECLRLQVCVSSTSLWEILGQRSYSFLFHDSAFFFLPATAQACAAAAASVMNCFFNLRLKALLQSSRVAAF